MHVICRCENPNCPYERFIRIALVELFYSLLVGALLAFASAIPRRVEHP